MNPGAVPAIAVASDLKYAFEEIASLFQASAQREVKLVFASSGGLFRRIEQGGAFHLFVSADERFVTKLAQARLTEGRGRFLGTGRNVVFARHQSRLTVDARLTGLRAALARGALQQLAIANPAYAAHGSAAAEALRKTGLWPALQRSLVVADNAAQAAQFATRSSADGGIFAYALAVSPPIARLGRYAVLAGDLHAPLRHRAVLIKGAGETARALYRFLQARPARTILARYGLAARPALRQGSQPRARAAGE